MKTLRELSEEIKKRHPELQKTKNGFSEEFADICFGLRIKKRYTQQELADAAQVDAAVIHRLEGGSVLLEKHIYSAVFAALGHTYEECLAYCQALPKK